MRHTDSIQAWKALLLVLKTGSISQTSLLMDLSIAKVSLLISGLESEFGYKLLNRSTRPFRPTKQAELLIPVLSPLVNGFEELIHHSCGIANKKVIRISSPIEISQEFYSSKLVAYSKTHQNVVFEVMTEKSPDAVLTGEVDVAVVNTRPVSESNLVVRPFMQTSTPVFCSPVYLRRYGVPETPEDLKNHTGFILKTQSDLTTQILYNRNRESAQLKWRQTFFTHDQLTIKMQLLKHQGISCDMYFGHILREIENGDLVPILPGWERAPWQMSIVTRQDREINDAALRDFAIWWAESESQSALERVIKGRNLIEKALQRMKA